MKPKYFPFSPWPARGRILDPGISGRYTPVRTLVLNRNIRNIKRKNTVEQVFLGIDIGTSGTKTLAIRPDGTIVGKASAEYPCSAPRPLWSEQNPDDWYRAVVKTVRDVVAASGIAPSAVRGIGLSGQMHGSVFLDAAGNVVRPAILWNDQRCRRVCRHRKCRRWPTRTSAGRQSGHDRVYRTEDSLASKNEPDAFAHTVKSSFRKMRFAVG